MVADGIFEMVAKTQAGLEEVLANEIAVLGGRDINCLRRAVSFKGDQALLYAANLWLRTAVRILVPFHHATAFNADELYNRASRINWGKYLRRNDTFAIDCITHGEYHHHSLFAAMRVKDAIADQFMQRHGERPSVDLQHPTLRINLHIFHEELTFSLDSSGDALQRRGYRLEQNEAPLNEVLAAGMVLLTGWDGGTNFGDLMCGSGTLLIEAAQIALNIAPGLSRPGFGFQSWRDYDHQLWLELVAQAEGSAVPQRALIYGSDIEPATVAIARRNIDRAGLSELITVECKDFHDARPPGDEGGILIMNPPYGDRLELDAIDTFYSELGDTLKQHFQNHQAWILSGNIDALKRIGLRASKKIPLLNGPIDCRFHCYDLYQGTRETKAKAVPEAEA
jgi:putative N6-adenine-specific DNA methylase